MPAIDGGPQEDPRWNEKDEPVKIKLTHKFDFQNIDVKLYLALKKLTAAYINATDDMSGSPEWETVKAAELALEEFELAHGPLPEWAVARNWDYSLVPGAQLCTRDGRRTGNAHIIKVDTTTYAGVHYACLTDAGSKFLFSAHELETAFTIGDWISDPARVLKDFDRNGEFTEEPK